MLFLKHRVYEHNVTRSRFLVLGSSLTHVRLGFIDDNVTVPMNPILISQAAQHLSLVENSSGKNVF